MRLTSIFEDKNLLQHQDEDIALVPGYRYYGDRASDGGAKLRVNILAMGDVGSTLAMAMMLTGSDIIGEMGLCDINQTVASRFEFEFGQFSMPCDYDKFPVVKAVSPDDLFDCDVFVFCAALGVPAIGSEKQLAENQKTDVRMVQLERNVRLVEDYAKKSITAGYTGEFFIVSDPVDPLCKGALNAGIERTRLSGCGLGVMNARAAFFARRNDELCQYLSSGRVYGPHGSGLIVADSITDYNNDKSLKLSELTINANLVMREMGFKPYIAPAVSSGAISILENLRGNWHYSSAYFGLAGDANAGNSGAFWGMKNRRTPDGLEIENPDLDPQLMDRIAKSYEELKGVI